MSLQGDMGEEGPKGHPGEKVCDYFHLFVYVLARPKETSRRSGTYKALMAAMWEEMCGDKT